MSEHVVQCAKFMRCDVDAGVWHVSTVATGQWPMYRQIWSMAEVCNAMASGDRFYIQSRDTKETFLLRRTTCSACRSADTLETDDPLARVKIRDLPVLR